MKTQRFSKSPDAVKPSSVVSITALIAFLILILGLMTPPYCNKEAARRAPSQAGCKPDLHGYKRLS